MIETSATHIHRIVIRSQHPILHDVADLVVEVHHRDESAVGFQARLYDFIYFEDPLAAPFEILRVQVGRLRSLAFSDPVALRGAILIVPAHDVRIPHDQPFRIGPVDHFIAAKRTAAEIQLQSDFLHEVEEMVEVEIRICFAFEIQNSGGMFRTRRAYQMRRPLHIGGDIFESGFFKLEKDRLPVTGFEAEVLNFAAEDVGAVRSRVD